MKVVEVEQPQCWKEHQRDIGPCIRKRSKTKEKLTDDFIDDENDLTIR